MTNKLEALAKYNERNEAEEYLYMVNVSVFKKYNDGTFHKTNTDGCFCLTNDFNHAIEQYKEACYKVPLTNKYYLITIEETKVDLENNEVWYETVEGYEITTITDKYQIRW